ncbi:MULTISPECIES: 6-carboxytetrahydropterin synthase [unclassified Azospirillum]|uniref:6-pyruvoyl trahydropterin synthase family protein n=1 Tax=unclassified Azospirillum TaxID=2630922 RepID=UPI000B752529|nr:MULTISPECIES: 6-carboxytetrahydropterin synthase [unclassified Azospirillum]SNS57841.1 6-pyruvoyl-tetrahydropterin synthase [Azospirillum sp. RU38E]SNS77700.1 6-pyruvoyl-tetrahydropterin synthase [Azospirillum sp. RU37A]
MYSLTVRDHIMIAHSFKGAIFGPAQQLHGATFVVDAEFRRPALSADGLVVDIGQAADLLKQVLAPLNYRNLDDVPELAGRNTTTEFLAGEIHRRLSDGIRAGALGADGQQVASLKISLHESHTAWAAFEAPVAGEVA